MLRGRVTELSLILSRVLSIMEHRWKGSNLMAMFQRVSHYIDTMNLVA